MYRRINEAEALSHDFHFHLAVCALQGVNLAVRVRDAEVIHILQDDGAHSAACERLCGPGTHSTDAHHCYTGGSQTLSSFQSVQAGNAAEAFFIYHKLC